jgi:hypothetical protein
MAASLFVWRRQVIASKLGNGEDTVGPLFMAGLLGTCLIIIYVHGTCLLLCVCVCVFSSIYSSFIWDFGEFVWWLYTCTVRVFSLSLFLSLCACIYSLYSLSDTFESLCDSYIHARYVVFTCVCVCTCMYSLYSLSGLFERLCDSYMHAQYVVFTYIHT